ncbi:NAD(P)-dependent dehydrogenase, short-chain alcohol dehydrogenase family [Evansella caseinilytica]|uniref:NAD(P)-dependent dehydrogenase, short-chain alcohol dehydrogenase family n=1 Tax=Evansella caseinilytica TaxID=1503961 RepID=A0A1H3R2Z0_9BACI|nr:SDR family oxidoreductase [Evansella caseinilytica]SDZ19681.1 NAD(P)-dependent dehydrogenase, short-chain alcohol dehydrogenase family [Evansella caseinilytica]
MKYSEVSNLQKNGQPPQAQEQQPGFEEQMNPQPIYDDLNYKGSGKLKDKAVIITGGDSGIGRAVAVAFAKEGARITIVYLNEHADAEKTKARIEKYGGVCLLMVGDIGDEAFCRSVVDNTVAAYGRLDCLINNAAEQHYQKNIEDITAEQMERTFKTNIFSCFYLTKAAMPHLQPGSTIINTASIVAYKGNPTLIDYSATKGAMIAFTRSLSQNIVSKGIRVNAVAPGPIWTPLIPASFPADQVAEFGTSIPMGRPGQPAELAPSYVFLASDDSSFVSGQVIHVNGGDIING